MASSNQTPDVLFSPIAANADASDINTIPQTYDPANYGYAAQNVGFPTECRLPVLNPDGTLGQGRAPRMQDWNGIMKLVSSHNFFLQNGGSYTFNPTVSSNIGGYPKNAVLWYFPENEAPCLVYSLINDNTNNFVNDPTLIDGEHWEMLVNPSSYANIALTNSPYTTNKILEIPQDIKLELSSGTLTLKDGSKCFLKTDTTTPSVEVSSDLTTTQTTNGTYFAIYNGSALTTVLTSTYDYSSLPSTYSLPLAVVTVSGGAISSIDQIFNGFGYIGSTVFVLPGIKIQIPNGKDSNGTNLYEIYTNDVVKLQTYTGSVIGRQIALAKTGLAFNVYTYDANENKILDVNNSTYKTDRVVIANVDFESGKVTSWNPYTVDSVVNSNASNFSQAGKSYLSGIGAPDINHYVDLTLGANGSAYVAPANGYFAIDRDSSSGNYISLQAYNSSNKEIYGANTAIAGGGRLTLPVLKRTTVKVGYTGSMTLYYFHFVYAVGEN